MTNTMSTLTYWLCKRIGGDSAYSIRATTRKAAQDARRGREADYEAPRKVIVVYSDPLDLLRRVLGEGGVEG